MNWWIYALLSAVFAALTAILVKLGIKGIDPDLGTALRTVVILILTWAIVVFKGKPLFSQLTYQHMFWLVLSGVATGLSWLFYFRALSLGQVSKVAPVDKLSVGLAMLLGVLILGESLSFKAVLGGMLMIAGVLLLIQS